MNVLMFCVLKWNDGVISFGLHLDYRLCLYEKELFSSTGEDLVKVVFQAGD